MKKDVSYWEERIARWSSSGLAACRWCSQEQESYHAFQYWRRKLKRSQDLTDTIEWAELQAEQSRPSEEFRVKIRCKDLELEVESCNVQTISALLLACKELC